MAKARFDTKALKGFGIKGKRQILRVAKEATSEAGNRIIARTPVDTGFARAGWFPTVNGQPGLGQGAVVAEVSFSGLKIGDRLGLASNVEYIVGLEYGHSAQAPEGMVRVTVMQWQAIVAEVATRVAAT